LQHRLSQLDDMPVAMFVLVVMGMIVRMMMVMGVAVLVPMMVMMIMVVVRRAVIVIMADLGRRSRGEIQQRRLGAA
jgi:uncharacterized protein (DUF983 family)